MSRRLPRVRGWGVLLAWAMMVAVLVTAFAAPVQATSLATNTQNLSSPDQVCGSPVVLHATTPCDTAAYIAASPSDPVRSLPMLLAITDEWTVAIHGTLLASKQLRMASGLCLVLPLGH